MSDSIAFGEISLRRGKEVGEFLSSLFGKSVRLVYGGRARANEDNEKEGIEMKSLADMSEEKAPIPFSERVTTSLQGFLTSLTNKKDQIDWGKGVFDPFLRILKSLGALTYDAADPESGTFLKRLDRVGDIVLGSVGFGAVCVVATVNLSNAKKKISDYKKGTALRPGEGQQDNLLHAEADRLQKNVVNLQGFLSFFDTAKGVFDLAGGATSLASQFVTSIGPMIGSIFGMVGCTAALPLIFNWHVNSIRSLIRQRKVRKTATEALTQEGIVLSKEDAESQVKSQYDLVTAYRVYKGKKEAEKRNYTLYRPGDVNASDGVNKIDCFHRLSKERHWKWATTTHIFKSVVDFACCATIATICASTVFGFGIAAVGVNFIPILNIGVWVFGLTAAGIALFGLYQKVSRENRRKKNIKEFHILENMLAKLGELESGSETKQKVLNQIKALSLVSQLEEKKDAELTTALNELQGLSDNDGLAVVKTELNTLALDTLKATLPGIKEALITELKEFEALKSVNNKDLRPHRIVKSARLFQALYDAAPEDAKLGAMTTFVQTQLYKRDSDKAAAYAVKEMGKSSNDTPASVYTTAMGKVLDDYLEHNPDYSDLNTRRGFLQDLYVPNNADLDQEAQILTGKTTRQEVAANLLKGAMGW